MSIKELKDKMTFFYLGVTDEFAIKYHLLPRYACLCNLSL